LVLWSGEEIVDVDAGARLWTVTVGAGRPVVLCHGGPGSTDTLAPVAAMLADVARVHRYEQRACGRSTGGPPYTMTRSARDLEALRRHWGHPRWVVAGHSFGAALALAYGLEHPDRTEAIIFVSCVVRLEGQPDWYEQYRQARLARIPELARDRYVRLRRNRDQRSSQDPAVEAELRRISVPTDFARPESAAEWADELEAEMAAVNNEVNRELGVDVERYYAAPGTSRRLGELTVPVLLVHGDADPRPLEAVNALAGVLPNGELRVLSGVGHHTHWEAPDRLRPLLRDFLATLEP
jgi:proline iminopeptidase